MFKKLFLNAGKDIPAGLVVFLVALPLCIAIAVASGATPFSGIIAGIVGGIVVGSISNSQLSVSGPAAGLATLVSGSIIALGGLNNFGLFLCALVVAGCIQILLGTLKLGGITNYIPSSVVKGMLTSIGILIIAKQIPHFFGKDADDKGHLIDLLPFTGGDWHELLIPIQKIEVGVTIISLLALVIMILWDASFLKKKLPYLPSALIAVIIAVVINQVWIASKSNLEIVEKSHLISLPIASNANEFFSFFTLPNFNGFFNVNVLIYGVIIALIASLETLLSIEAIDNIDPQRRTTNTNRELIAQGIGNTVSGLIGGLPITSVIVRSSANVNAGGKTKLAAIFHAFLLLVCVILIPGVLCMIPKGVLASVLILTGWKLAKPAVFKSFWSAGKYQFIPFIVTVIVIISVDLFNVIPPLNGKGLIIGVLAGIITSIVSILHGNLKNSYYFHEDKHNEGDTITIHLSEEVSFLNKASIKKTLDHLPEKAEVIIDASNTKYIDFDVLHIIKEFRDIKAPLKKINLGLIGFKEIYEIQNLEFVKSSK
ncbi:MAG: SulP family inorganic anion transporter [Bacteroidetes bacterium]|nr:SulP family inorganic anion transporter [Bacteroidota bacterium]